MKATAGLAIAVIASSFAFGTPVNFAAATTVASDGKTKINLAGRQRMLSQRMAKAACFAHLEIQPADHLKMLDDAHTLFVQTLEGLKKGDADQGMLPENNPEIVNDLAQVAQLWAGFQAVNEDILAKKTISDDQLSEISEINLPVLRQMHKTVGTIEKVYGSSGEVHPALALALNVSGRQRMLSQKASKEFCLVVAGVDVENSRAALKDTVELFEASLSGLINGDAAKALAPAPTPEILAQLQLVQQMWDPLHAIFLKVVEGDDASEDEINVIATNNNALLVEMNKAVFMYNAL
ncbi:MAG: type IV pili methyl-accepting chemotaxis transducer N-terminal domain-containing protein [Pseudomonadota bacterium]